ncbi:hypothetical protein [Methylobacterium sp. J-090]|uniref:hypothetical protein n=1 Tax=Methylobacterium sp. J-090 TaxID=2836666 RepID=UPI001FBB58C9|nr:hypothetical protein [Methylobacterium sp. J-090]MCJ2079844.1 hypothetical protein [Methylobacterium sp. J-090]
MPTVTFAVMESLLDAMPAKGILRSVVAYDCNPLQRALGWSIISMLQPLEFEILPKAPS